MLRGRLFAFTGSAWSDEWSQYVPGRGIPWKLFLARFRVTSFRLSSPPLPVSKVCNKCGVRQGRFDAVYLDSSEVDADWELSDIRREGREYTQMKFMGVEPLPSEPSRHWLNRETRAKPALEGEPPEGFWDAMALLVDMSEGTRVMTLAERRGLHKYLMWMDPEVRQLYRHYNSRVMPAHFLVRASRQRVR